MKGRDSNHSAASEMYRSLLVHLDPTGDNSSVLRVASKLTEMFGSHVIGLCAAQPIELLCDEGTAIRKASIRDRAALEKDLEKREVEFRAEFLGKSLEWRSAITYEPLADLVAVQARSADLIISAGNINHSPMDEDRHASVGRLAIKAGRPLLLVPTPAPNLSLNRAIVAWKNVREARRAVHDAIPFLKLADAVTLLTITSEQERSEAETQLKDVSQCLGEYDIAAEVAVIPTNSARQGYLHAELLSRRCDFLVAGAYGHTRLDEWIFGGVTRDILLKAEFLSLVSH